MDYESFGSNLSSPSPPSPLFAKPTTPRNGEATTITIPDMQCPCGGGICYIRTSKTERNPWRQFYNCPRRPACGFFLWCDERSSDVSVAVTPYPMCSCGAGTCTRLKVMKEGKNKGRFFFVCPVTKGQGACSFFQWEDEIKQQSPQLTLAVQESPEMVEKTVTLQGGAYGHYGNEFKKSFSPGSVVRGSESQLTEEYTVKEDEVVGSNSGGVHDKILSPMRNLRVSEERNTCPVAKPVQWAKECFKCGETGHWMKDCTA